MSPEAFTALLVCGAGALALWVIARYTDFGPRSIAGAIVHVVAAMVLLTVLLPTAIDAVDAIGIPASTYVQVFGVALPLFVYAFLSGGWVTRAAIGLAAVAAAAGRRPAGGGSCSAGRVVARFAD